MVVVVVVVVVVVEVVVVAVVVDIGSSRGQVMLNHGIGTQNQIGPPLIEFRVEAQQFTRTHTTLK